MSAQVTLRAGQVYIAHVSLECVDSELVITLSVPFRDEARWSWPLIVSSVVPEHVETQAAAAAAPSDARSFLNAEQGKPRACSTRTLAMCHGLSCVTLPILGPGKPHDSALFGFQELLHSFRVVDWGLFGDEGIETEPAGGS